MRARRLRCWGMLSTLVDEAGMGDAAADVEKKW